MLKKILKERKGKERSKNKENKMKKIKAARVIAIVSGKGGVGKTVTAANIAASLNLLGKEVIAVDGNITTPHLALHFGAPSVPVTLHQVLKEKNKIREAVYEHHSGTKIVPGSIVLKDLYNLKIDHEKFNDVITDLRKKADMIVIDSSPGLGPESMMSLKAADDVVIVMNPDIFSASDALKIIKISKNLGKNVKGIVVAKAKLDDKEIGVDNIKELIEEPILAVIEDDDLIRASVSEKDAVIHTAPGSKVATSYVNLTKKILGVTK
jgi:septum site-determining protein MinD